MRSLRNLPAVAVLTCVLAVSALADGDMGTPITKPSPRVAAATVSEKSKNATAFSDPFTSIALNLLQTLLSLI